MSTPTEEDYTDRVAERCACLMKQTKTYAAALEKMRVMTAGGMLKNLDSEELDDLASHTLSVCRALESEWLEKVAHRGLS